jgi:hypothetical protein
LQKLTVSGTFTQCSNIDDKSCHIIHVFDTKHYPHGKTAQVTKSTALENLPTISKEVNKKSYW